MDIENITNFRLNIKRDFKKYFYIFIWRNEHSFSKINWAKLWKKFLIENNIKIQENKFSYINNVFDSFELSAEYMEKIRNRILRKYYLSFDILYND